MRCNEFQYVIIRGHVNIIESLFKCSIRVRRTKHLEVRVVQVISKRPPPSLCFKTSANLKGIQSDTVVTQKE